MSDVTFLVLSMWRYVDKFEESQPERNATGLMWAIGTVRGVPCAIQKVRPAGRAVGGTLDGGPGACNGAPPGPTMLPCAPTPGTEILTGRIRVGSQHEDSAKGIHGTTHGRTASTTGGNEGGRNASLEGLAG
ncbi:hypothetical protein GCM10023084_21610 [Streptomyces lacrimifluminis]|uniref:Uncharacterized protein n=1 Tax=Streptomyces lacrimifluminis TaxID=1500077 RepID=A0A917L010_9ACTN|nr:hypothetical protein GCM10012282_35820 [Streptomyces lacrimifluminis]